MTQTNGLGRFEIALLVGTRKGGFVLSSGAERKHWELSEVHCRGGDVYHIASGRAEWCCTVYSRLSTT